jgi:hypothetical protein
VLFRSLQDVSCIMSLSVGALLRRKPVSAGTSHNSCGAQGHDTWDAFLLLMLEAGR